MTGAQRTTRSRVPLLSPNAKICTISSEGTLMLQTTKRIFGLHTAQTKRSWWITRNSGKLAAHIFWRRRSIFPMHRNIMKMVFTCLERKISKRLWLTSLSRKQIWSNTILWTAISAFSRNSARRRPIANNCTNGSDSRCAFSSRSTQSHNINRGLSFQSHLQAVRAQQLLLRREIGTTTPTSRQMTNQRQVADRYSFWPACILFFYVPDSPKKLHKLWQQTYKSAMKAENLDSTPISFTDEEAEWCKKSIESLQRLLTDAQREERGLSTGLCRAARTKKSAQEKAAAAAAAGQGAQGSVRRRAAAETSDDSDLAPTLKVPRGWVCWSLHNLHNEHNEHNLHNEHNIHNLHNMHNMHNLLVGFENFPFCAARRERAFLKSPLQQPPRSSVKTLLWCFNLRSDRGGGLRNYWQFRRCIPPVPQRSDVGRHLHHIPPGVRCWICWLMLASTGGLYFLLAVSCILVMCMTSLQRSQVLHPFSSTDLWLLVLLHVGERGWPCSGGY